MCVGLQISRTHRLRNSAHRSPGRCGCVCCVPDTVPLSSPHTLIVPGSQQRMKWTFICRMSLLPREPSGEGRKLMITVQHKGRQQTRARRKQWLFLCFLLWRRHDGSHPDTEVTVLICPFLTRIPNQSGYGHFHLDSLLSEMWPWDIHSCPWKSDSPGACPPTPHRGIPLLLLFMVSFRRCLSWILAWLFWPVKPSIVTEIYLPFLAWGFWVFFFFFV